jgi:hypothetical protein
MSQLPLKEFVVYWASEFNGKNPGYGTPQFKPNMMTFTTLEAAQKLQAKLQKLQDENGLYRGRLVRHVSPCI